MTPNRQASVMSRLNLILRDHAAPVATGVVVALIAVTLAILLWPRPMPAPATERVVQMVQVEQKPPAPEVPQPEVKPEEVKEELVPKPDPIVPVEMNRTVAEKPSATPATVPDLTPPTKSREQGGLNRLADAGSDSFQLAAGRGGGLFGRGGGSGGGGDWEAAVALHITRALQRDPRTRAARGSVAVSVEIEADGRFGSARLRSSTGDPALDAALRNVLNKLSPMNRPRPLGVGAATNMTIDLKQAHG